MNSILYNGKMRVENQTKTQVGEDPSLCPEIPLKMQFKDSTSGFFFRDNMPAFLLPYFLSLIN
jgi:hypothetical protein